MKSWKLVAIIAAGILMTGTTCMFGIQISQNKAISLEQAVETALSDIARRENDLHLFRNYPVLNG